jgi:hypothetical protein
MQVKGKDNLMKAGLRIKNFSYAKKETRISAGFHF